MAIKLFDYNVSTNNTNSSVPPSSGIKPFNYATDIVTPPVVSKPIVTATPPKVDDTSNFSSFLDTTKKYKSLLGSKVSSGLISVMDSFNRVQQESNKNDFELREMMGQGAGKQFLQKDPVSGKTSLTTDVLENYKKQTPEEQQKIITQSNQNTPLMKAVNSPLAKEVYQTIGKYTSNIPLKGYASIKALGDVTYDEAYKALVEKSQDPSNTTFDKFLYGLQDSGPQTAIGILLGLGVSALSRGKVSPSIVTTPYFAAISANSQVQEKGRVDSLGNIAIDTIGDTLLSKVSETVLKSVVKEGGSKIVKTLKETSKGFVSEGGTEVSQTFLKYANDYKNAPNEDEKQKVVENVVNYVKSGDMTLEFLIGGTAGGVITGTASIASKSNNPIVIEHAKNNKIMTETMNYIKDTKEVETPEEVVLKLIEAGMDQPTATKMMQESVLQDIQQSSQSMNSDALNADIEAFMAGRVEAKPIEATDAVDQMEVETKARIKEAEDQVSKLSDELSNTRGENSIMGKSIKEYTENIMGQDTYQILSTLDKAERASKEDLSELLGSESGQSGVARFKNGRESKLKVSKLWKNASEYAEFLGYDNQAFEKTDEVDFLQGKLESFRRLREEFKNRKSERPIVKEINKHKRTLEVLTGKKQEYISSRYKKSDKVAVKAEKKEFNSKNKHEYAKDSEEYKAQEKGVAKMLEKGKSKEEVAKDIQENLGVSENYARKLVGLEEKVVEYKPTEEEKAIEDNKNIIKEMSNEPEFQRIESLYEEKPKKQIPTEENLIVHHNLTEANLIHADELGGLPIPSVAISNKDNVTSAFGDIILIGNKELIDPSIKSNKVYNADSYSARYPTIQYEVTNRKLLQTDFKDAKEYFSDKDVIRNYEESEYMAQSVQEDGGKYSIAGSRGVKAIFAMKKGVSKDMTRDQIEIFARDNSEEFTSFVKEIKNNFGITSSLFNGYTYSGKRRKGLPHTIDNVVKKMKGTGRADEGFNYGVGSFRSAVAKKFKNIKQIQADRTKLISNEEMTKLGEETSKEFEELMTRHNVNDYFRFSDNLVDYELGKISATELKEYTGIDDGAIKDFEEFGKKLAEMPSEYFEAKVQRAVDISEFKIALVPDNISKEAKEILTRKGLIVEEYNKDNRQEIIDKATKLDDNILFQREEPANNLTLKTLEKLKGRESVSKQFIMDLTNSGDIKQVERDLIRKILEEEGDKVNVPDFIQKVQAELLPLTVSEVWSDFQKYESVSLPDDLRGNVKNYKEKIYESPIQTSVGDIHFKNQDTSNYFGHTRTEDMAGNKIRRVIEVQSDLFQRGRLEEEVKNRLNENGDIDPRGYIKMLKQNEADPKTIKDWEDKIPAYDEAVKKAEDQISKLQQYNNPTAHFRMVREEVKQAAIDGKKDLLFPTGETAMKIEGLGTINNWEEVGGQKLSSESIKVGQEIQTSGNDLGEDLDYGSWVITDNLGEGKFKAIPRNEIDMSEEALQEMGYESPDDAIEAIKLGKKDIVDFINNEISSSIEQFDISGKVDTNNPIYKFYNKELRNYLKNRYEAKEVTDKQGVTWIEVAIKPEMAESPVEAFQRKDQQKDEMSFEDGKKTLEAYKKRLNLNFDVNFADVIFTGEVFANGEKVRARGVTHNNAITLTNNLTNTTADHELVHLIVDNLANIDAFEGITRENLLKAQNKGREVDYSNRAEVERLNEELAIGFEKKLRGDNQSNVPIIIRRFFEKLQVLLSDFLKAFDIKQRNAIADFYRRLLTSTGNKNTITLKSNPAFASMARFNKNGKTGLDFSYRNMREMDDIRPNTSFERHGTENMDFMKEFMPEYYDLVTRNDPERAMESVFKNAMEFLGLEAKEGEGMYDKVTFKDQIAKALTIVRENESVANEIAMGTKKAPEGVNFTAISIAVQAKAMKDKNWKLFKDVAEVRSSKQTEAGQSIVLEKLRNIEMDSFAKIYSDFQELQNNLVKEKFYKNWLHSFNKENKESVEKTIRKATEKEVVKLDKKLQIENIISGIDINSILNSLAC